jgi:hypothetical protein
LLPFSINASWGISEAYFWQWAEGQSKVLQLALILLAIYLGKTRRPAASGIVYGLSLFDPVVALLAVPLIFVTNKSAISKAVTACLLTVIVANVPVLLLQGVLAGFYKMLTAGGYATPLYYYTYIPVTVVIALIIAMWKDIYLVWRIGLGGRLGTRPSLPRTDLDTAGATSRLSKSNNH